MRSFLSTHWKSIVALVILILLAAVTLSSEANDASLAARLHRHAQAIAPGDDSTPETAPDHISQYIQTTLARSGYRVQRHHDHAGDNAPRKIEVSLANLAAGQRPARMFIVGAHINASPGPPEAIDSGGAAAVLELARLLRRIRPTPGTELRFVFLVNKETSGSFIAFVGPRESSALVAQRLAAFRNGPELPAEGLAAPAYVQGVTVSSNSAYRYAGRPAVTITDTAFQRYPYFHMDDEATGTDCEDVARVVAGLFQTIAALAGTASS